MTYIWTMETTTRSEILARPMQNWFGHPSKEAKESEEKVQSEKANRV